MPTTFDRLSTTEFQKRMKAAALRIYSACFPGCQVEDLRDKGVRVHILDQEFGIDSLIHLQSGQWISIQEKYRHHKFLVNPRFQVIPGTPDFTQEYLNAEGTTHQNPGEWFKLGAQLYFYGWANAPETEFEKWAIIDIPKYKLIVEAAGGLPKIGEKNKNSEHGKSSFYAIPITRLKESFVFTHRSVILPQATQPEVKRLTAGKTT